MQDEVNTRVVALAIRTGSQSARITASVLKAAMRKYLEAESQRKQQRAAQKTAQKTAQKAGSSVRRGRQTVGQLMEQNQGLTNIEITDRNIKSFERVANKYNIDYALKKDKSMDPPRYLVFFKARDVDVMTAAFKEYSGKELLKSKKPSITKALAKAQQKAQAQNRQREKVKQKDRGQEL